MSIAFECRCSRNEDNINNILYCTTETIKINNKNNKSTMGGYYRIEQLLPDIV